MGRGKQPIVFKLCSKDNDPCPEVTITSKTVRIKDDYGGEVNFTREQLQILVEKVEELNIAD